MACTNPMLMLVTPIKSMTDYFILKEHGWKCNLKSNKAYRLASKESRSYLLESIPRSEAEGATYELVEVPCGNCISCRLDYSREWASRCTLEASQYSHNYFITLTYDEDHMPKGNLGNPTILKEDWQSFIKNVRQLFIRKFGFQGIRYFACGEYGDKTFRPHMHAILFNCPIPDLTKDFKDDNGQITRHYDSRGVPYKFSSLIASCWQKGFILIADANYNTNAYVSGYILKKQKGKNGVIYKKLGIEAPFLLMSKGIGDKHFTEHYEALKESPRLFIGREHREPLKLGVPRYFKKKVKQNDPEFYEEKFVENAKRTSEAFNSLIRGKQLINTQREIKESQTETYLRAKNRTL